jgi:cyclohexyl-isocyanide hydratase
MTLHVGMMLFPSITQLDLTGPYEVFGGMPNTQVHLVSNRLEPVESEYGLKIIPTTTLEACPPVDILFVPGGRGIHAVIQSEAHLSFLVRQAEKAKYVTSVCTGALVLGAAGLLQGYRATTHWLSLDLLPIVGATPVAERIVMDRNRITGGGVTAGIDFGLYVAAQLFGKEVAEATQLMMEYDPAPPFHSGSPKTAAPDLTQRIRESRREIQSERRRLLSEAIRKLRQT